MNGYRLITTRIADRKYQHELRDSDGTCINIGDLPERSMDIVLDISRNDVRALEHMKENGIGRGRLEVSLSLGVLQ